MVEQRRPSKTSSDHTYEFKGCIEYSALLPVEAAAGNGEIVGKLAHDQVINPELWKDPPHIAFANLRLESKALEAFIETYGLLFSADAESGYSNDELASTQPDPGNFANFRESISDLESAQEVLRRAWCGSSEAKADLEGEIEEGFEIQTLQVHYGFVGIRMADLWTFICFLFILDEMNGNLAQCANPTCPAPFFVASRRTQRFCELGPCTEYAQRQYALKWWRDKGAKRRTKKRSSSAKRRKNDL